MKWQLKDSFNRSSESFLLRPETKAIGRTGFLWRSSKLQRLVFILLGFQQLNIAFLWQYMSVGVEPGSARFFLNLVVLFSYAALMGLVILMVFLFGQDMPMRQARAQLEIGPSGLRWLPSAEQQLSKDAKNVSPLLSWCSIDALSYGAISIGSLFSNRVLVGERFFARPWLHTLNLFSADKRQIFRIPITDFDQDQRRKLMTAIRRWAPHLNVPRDVYEALLDETLPEKDSKYTELWLQLLESSSTGKQSDYLAEGALLRDGAFRILKRLETGGQANVYAAVVNIDRLPSDDPLRRSCLSFVDLKTVVLKEFIPAACTGDDARLQSLSSFEREVSILSVLEHESIVNLLDCFVDAERAYLVLEHVEGMSLRRYVDCNGAIPERQAAAIALEACKVLSYLHGLPEPVVHRDLSPDNILLCGDGKIKVIDFSVAAMGLKVGFGEVVGKQSYISPEQFRGSLSTQGDIYALGATLHFILAGADPVPISQSHPRAVDEELSEAMDRIVADCTALDVQRRYQSAGELSEDLKSFIAGGICNVRFPERLFAENFEQFER